MMPHMAVVIFAIFFCNALGKIIWGRGLSNSCLAFAWITRGNLQQHSYIFWFAKPLNLEMNSAVDFCLLCCWWNSATEWVFHTQWLYEMFIWWGFSYWKMLFCHSRLSVRIHLILFHQFGVDSWIQVMGDSNHVGIQHPFVQALRYPNKNRGHLNCTGLLMIDCGDDKNKRMWCQEHI